MTRRGFFGFFLSALPVPFATAKKVYQSPRLTRIKLPAVPRGRKCTWRFPATVKEASMWWNSEFAGQLDKRRGLSIIQASVR